jgi:LysR family transcriptional activator of nhaA
MLNYNHLYYFHVVATEGSFANAAERLGVTQPTISEQVKALERALGVMLFERQPSGLRLTEEGRVAFEHTTVMFRAGDNLRHALGHDSATMPRTLRVGISGAAGRSTATGFLLPLLALPDCIPSIRSGDSSELLRDVRSAELDLAVIETEPTAAAHRGLEVMALDTVTLIAVAVPGTKPAADWVDVGLVHYRPSSALRWDVDAYLDAGGLRPKIVAEADDALFLVEAAARGGYVSFVPKSVVRDAINSGRLIALASTQATHAGIFAVFQDGSRADLARRAVQLLMEHMSALSTLDTSSPS